VVLSARVCNRGQRAVGSKLPATFYDKDGKALCTSFTTDVVKGSGDCQLVTCEADMARVVGSVKIVVNDDGMGGRTTVECRQDNNSDQIVVRPEDCIIQ